MIISENKKPPLSEFQQLILETDKMLNQEAIGKETYYQKRNGIQIEEDVFYALKKCAINTAFENTIHLVSGATFPDIIANKFYGIEVKSTIKNNWKSIGGSILESTRNKGVEKIFLTFGKLAPPITFKTRPYDECLSGIAVTHYPRYQIDMDLQKGETIFDKMGVEYDVLRKMDNPVALVSKYYKSKLRVGESLWWAADGRVEEAASAPTIKLWNILSSEEKNTLTAQGYALFPEILSAHQKKYERFALWLATACSVINTNIRDQFSAGGQVDILMENQLLQKMPAAFRRIVENRSMIIETILFTHEDILAEYWQVDKIADNRLKQWCHLVCSYYQHQEKINFEQIYELMTSSIIAVQRKK